MRSRDQHTPPRLADTLLTWFCAPHLLEDLQGDLHELFYRHLHRRGITYAHPATGSM